jgi:ribosomal protein L19
MNLLQTIEAEEIARLAKEIPDFSAGDTIRVGYKVVEGTRSRVQAYEGVCIARNGGKGIGASFTVRKISFGEGSSACSPCIRRTSTALPWSAAARSAAPSSTICARAAANRPASSRRPITGR